jgi:glycosyltransferase involved in cell wall biosynthesis
VRILIFNSVFFPTKIGGAEQSVFNLAEGLVGLGHEVAVVSIDEEAKGVEKRVLNNGVICFYLEDFNLYWPFGEGGRIGFFKKLMQKALDLKNFRYKKAVGDILDAFQPDVVHTNNLKGISTIVWNEARARSCRTVHTLRDYYLQCHKCSKRNGEINCELTCVSCKLYSLPKQASSKSIDHVVGISDFILDSHIRDGFFSKSNSSVIYNSVGSGGNSPRRLLSNTNLVFGYIGRLEVDKGVSVLLERISEVTSELGVRFVVAGKGDEDLEGKLTSNENIDYKGYVAVDDFFKEIDYLIVPSLWYEPMGRVVIEAYAHGVPVLVNKSGGLVELVEDGITGVLTNVLDATTFKKDLKLLISLEYAALSIECLKKSVQFSNVPMVERYLSVYRGDSLK